MSALIGVRVEDVEKFGAELALIISCLWSIQHSGVAVTAEGIAAMTGLSEERVASLILDYTDSLVSEFGFNIVVRLV